MPQPKIIPTEENLIHFTETLMYCVRQEPNSSKAFSDVCKILYLKLIKPQLLRDIILKDIKKGLLNDDPILGASVEFGISPSTFESILVVLEKSNWIQLPIQKRGLYFETFMNLFLIEEGSRYNNDLVLAPAIMDYMIETLAPKKEEVIMNLHCNGGNFLVKVHKYVKQRITGDKINPFFYTWGVNANYVNHVLWTKLNLWMHDVQATLYHHRISTFDKTNEPQLDIILGIYRNRIHPQFGNSLEKYLKWLKPGGRIGIILDEHLLTSDAKMREAIEQEAKLLKIVALPQTAFYNTTIKASIVFLQKFTETEKARFEQKPFDYKILYADIENIGKRSIIPYFKAQDNQLLTLLQEHKNYKSGAPIEHQTLLKETNYTKLVNWSVDYLKNQLQESNLKYTQLKIGELINKNYDFITIEESMEYKRVTVRANNEGVELRDKVLGKDIKNKKQFLIKAGQLIMAKLNPTSGAVGIVPIELDQAIVTEEFSTYTVKTNIALPEYLVLLFSSPTFTNYLTALTTGSVMLRLNESLFLNIEIPVPSLQEQKELCQKIMELKPQIKSLQENLIQEKKIFENKIFKIQ